ncbi:hypothetical protein FFI89_025465 [Bradyrhizobium sp. KBS0727]|jgi:hypothetical protein|uniref:hypothetical protein n=1 Tax=unclassified Bradyrhizobium TaxID=2631580 RepID=UPI00110EF719|nr:MULTISPECIES: hypothetical protein [unclassified Bradyrhizobium]QDW40186.1 hypothetical protein FFI71_025470 [Bradyrhizobium sp. KBS0725]QDW46789.1 hypothetical protein FFI89_025465 [Bradyrhizobium sp. KBS0727]
MGFASDRAFEVIGAGTALCAMPLRDDWAKLELKIVMRAAHLSGAVGWRWIICVPEQPQEPRHRGRINH